MNKIRVLFTIPNFISAGSGQEMVNIIERLDKNVFEVYVAVQQRGGRLFDELIQKKYPILVTTFIVEEKYGLAKRIALAVKLAGFFRPYKFDIWQSFNWSSDFTESIVARLSGARFVYVKKNMNWDRLAWKVKSFLSNAIIARNTTLMEKHLSPFWLKRKSYMVQGGVSANNISSRSVNIRQELGISQTVHLITCVAQIVRVKDQGTLIKAIAKIDNVYLVLAGANKDEKYATELRALIDNLGLSDRVHMPGSVTDVRGLLSATDVFVLPTTKRYGHEEGCPVALLEAMSAGVPCIASDVAGNRDLIRHNKTGLLFPPDNVGELAECIHKYMTEPSYGKRLADAALQKIKQKHTLEREAEGFAQVYKKLVRK